MTCPLQIISMSDEERTTIYQTYMRETVAIIQQTRERNPSPFNDLAPRTNDHEYQTWTTKNHIMAPNYILDQIGFLSPGPKADV